MRRVVLGVGAALLAAAPAQAHKRPRGLVERVAADQCAQTRPVPCLRRAAIHWHVDTGTLVRKARCESELRWWARNPSGAAGLMQFLPSTWATTPYAGRWILSAKYSALAAGYMHRVGRGGEWSCA